MKVSLLSASLMKVSLLPASCGATAPARWWRFPRYRTHTTPDWWRRQGGTWSSRAAGSPSSCPNRMTARCCDHRRTGHQQVRAHRPVLARSMTGIDRRPSRSSSAGEAVLPMMSIPYCWQIVTKAQLSQRNRAILGIMWKFFKKLILHNEFHI